MHRILAKYSDPKASGTTVVLIDPDTGKSQELQTPRPSLGSLTVVESSGKLLISTVGGSSKKPSAVLALEVNSPDELLAAKPSQWVVLREASTTKVNITRVYMQKFDFMHCFYSIKSISYPPPKNVHSPE